MHDRNNGGGGVVSDASLPRLAIEARRLICYLRVRCRIQNYQRPEQNEGEVKARQAFAAKSSGNALNICFGISLLPYARSSESLYALNRLQKS